MSNFSSNSQMANYLDSLSSMLHFRFHQVKELELSQNCTKVKMPILMTIAFKVKLVYNLKLVIFNELIIEWHKKSKPPRLDII